MCVCVCVCVFFCLKVCAHGWVGMFVGVCVCVLISIIYQGFGAALCISISTKLRHAGMWVNASHMCICLYEC